MRKINGIAQITSPCEQKQQSPEQQAERGFI
jgi:hypothetical protein